MFGCADVHNNTDNTSLRQNSHWVSVCCSVSSGSEYGLDAACFEPRSSERNKPFLEYISDYYVKYEVYIAVLLRTEVFLNMAVCCCLCVSSHLTVCRWVSISSHVVICHWISVLTLSYIFCRVSVSSRVTVCLRAFPPN